MKKRKGKGTRGRKRRENTREMNEENGTQVNERRRNGDGTGGSNRRERDYGDN